MTFQEKLVKLRKIKGITQDELASVVGVSRQAVYKWEVGQSMPEALKLVELKKVFGISIDDLLDDTYEVVVPEKKKKRVRSADRARIEEEVRREEEVAAPDAAPEAEVVEETTAVEETPTTEVPAEETTAPEVAAEETVAEAAPMQEEPKKKGFFAKLFGW